MKEQSNNRRVLMTKRLMKDALAALICAALSLNASLNLLSDGGKE